MKIIIATPQEKNILGYDFILSMYLMKRKTYVYIGLAILLLVLILCVTGIFCTGNTEKFCIRNTCFHLEIADTPSERAKGLMFREELAADHGMLFVFPNEGMHAFWMKNTLIPLDMIRLDSNYRIVDIQEATPCQEDPCARYTPQDNASYVIELRQGTAKKL